MAFVDDPVWLLSHVQHSFITSDDTGMCEMVVHENDLMTLSEHRENIQNEKKSRLSNSKRSPESIKEALSMENIINAPSPDILAGWDFGVRRRSNTAQKLERIRKERQNRVKVKTIHWNDFENETSNLLLEKKKFNMSRLEICADEVDGLRINDEEAPNSPESNGQNNSPSPKSITDQISNQLKNRKQTVTTTHGFKIDPEIEDVESKETIEEHKLSVLSQQLLNCTESVENPYKEYSRFNGKGHEFSHATQSIEMFIWINGKLTSDFPIGVSILIEGAKIYDLIGLTCWQYFSENRTPKLRRFDVQDFSLYISEDDGEVDYGFPALDSHEPVSKFSFPTLALVEKPTASDDYETISKQSVFVKINDYTGFSLIQIDDLSIKMEDLLKKCIKRRKGNHAVGTYCLEYQNKPGVIVDTNQTLDSTGTMEFYMLREHSARNLNHYPVKKKKRHRSSVRFQTEHKSHLKFHS